MSLCMKCGNEILGYEECAVCAAGRGGVVVARPHDRELPKATLHRCRCPYCESLMGTEQWDGTPVLSCRECRGTFFPDNSFEAMLNELRRERTSIDVSTVLEDFKKRFHRKLPPAVRYRHCPVCETPMKRTNYGTHSGVIVHQCAQHGTFVGELEMAQLADYILRGGDELTERAHKIRVSLSLKKDRRVRSVLDHLFRG